MLYHVCDSIRINENQTYIDTGEYHCCCATRGALILMRTSGTPAPLLLDLLHLRVGNRNAQRNPQRNAQMQKINELSNSCVKFRISEMFK